MDIEIEFKSGIPLCDQIANQVLALIEKEKLGPGDQLPTTRELAVQLGINFNTVARAYRILDQAAIISTQQGRGTFILKPNKTNQRQGQKIESIEGLTRFYLRKATYLGFKPDEIKSYFEKIAQEEK